MGFFSGSIKNDIKNEINGVVTKILSDHMRLWGHSALSTTQVVKLLWQIHLFYLGPDTF